MTTSVVSFVHNLLSMTVHISSRFSRNSKTRASEIHENVEEMFPQYFNYTILSYLFPKVQVDMGAVF